MKEVLVTGGTSYIGKHCIAQLIEKGYNVRTTVRDINRKPTFQIMILFQLTGRQKPTGQV